ncbi:hypothetical protein, partial [Bacteroides thetaiotaomicron]|uniref:hypothetical protein n=1 Tax=Bacteroides thetaiotaomicron TaxID=818 RepID=UPI00321BBBA5
MADNQEVIDKLIDYIDQAILKNSVSNRDVATVLSFLNERYKNMSGSQGKRIILFLLSFIHLSYMNIVFSSY